MGWGVLIFCSLYVRGCDALSSLPTSPHLFRGGWGPISTHRRHAQNGPPSGINWRRKVWAGFCFFSIWRLQLWWVDIHWVTLSCDCSLISQLPMTSCMTLAGTRPGPEYISWDRQTDGSLPHCASLGKDRSVKQPLFNTWVINIYFLHLLFCLQYTYSHPLTYLPSAGHPLSSHIPYGFLYLSFFMCTFMHPFHFPLLSYFLHIYFFICTKHIFLSVISFIQHFLLQFYFLWHTIFFSIFCRFSHLQLIDQYIEGSGISWLWFLLAHPPITLGGWSVPCLNPGWDGYISHPNRSHCWRLSLTFGLFCK